MEALYILIGLLSGSLIVYLIFQNKVNSSQSSLLFQNKELKESILQKENIIEKKNQQLILTNSELAKSNEKLSYLEEKLNTQKKEVNDLQDKFSIEFKNLANNILEEKSKKFTQQNKENIDQILMPLNEKIANFQKKVEETYDKEAQQRFSLKEEVKRLAELNQKISKEANNLTKALKGDNKTQGNWGEVILENILEKSGLTKNREYFIQESHTNSDGKRYQPDVIVKYPGDRHIIIDSKVSIIAYNNYQSSDNDEEKEIFIKEHITSIKTHITGLSKKNYQDLYKIKDIDFVIMFVPIEPAYLIAIQHDTELWNTAYEKRILLISPTNLITALKMIVSMWRQEYQNKNALEIARQSGELYDKFVGFLEDMQDVESKITQTQKGIHNAMNKLTTGKGNLIKRAEKIKDLGIKTKKTIPSNLLDQAD